MSSIGYSVFGVEANTNSVAETANYVLERKNLDIWETLGNKMERSGTDATMDHFGPLTTLSYINLSDTIGYRTHDYISSTGRDTVERTAIDSLRETAATFSIAQDWKWLDDLWAGSIGNTAEENYNVVSITPSESEKTFWQNIKSDGSMNYGIRLDNPSIYTTIRAGHWLHNPLFIIHARINYRPINRSNADLDMAIPLPFGEMSGGISFDLIGSRRATVTSFRISHGFLNSNSIHSTHWLDSMSCFIGVSHNDVQRVTQFQTGLVAGF